MSFGISLEVIYMPIVLFFMRVFYKSFTIFVSLIFNRLFIFCYRFFYLFLW
nr:MAG TPA_asm: hypothetical protein [Caudoviricetes sp.]